MLGGSGGTGGSGAAVLIDSAGPIISNCIFTGGVVSVWARMKHEL